MSCAYHKACGREMEVDALGFLLFLIGHLGNLLITWENGREWEKMVACISWQ